MKRNYPKILRNRKQRIARRLQPALIKKYDSNTNGLIDLDEWSIYRQDVKQRPAEKRAARLAAANAATNAAAPASLVSTNPPPKQ